MFSTPLGILLESLLKYLYKPYINHLRLSFQLFRADERSWVLTRTWSVPKH